MEQLSVDTAGLQPKIKGLSVRGLWEVFYKPASFFEQLKNDPKILVPYLVGVLLFALFFVVASGYLAQIQTESPQFQERLQGQEVTPQVLQMVRISTMVMGTISMALYPLLVAALALFFGNFVMAGKASYSQLLSVALYGTVIYAVGEVLVLPLMLAKDSADASFSLAVLAAGQGITSPTYVALSKIGIFNIWEFIVVAIGFSTIYGFTRNKGYLLAVLSVGLLSVVGVMMTWIGNMF